MDASGTESRTKRRWFGRREFWIGMGLLLMLTAMLFEAYRDHASRTARISDAEPPKTEPPTGTALDGRVDVAAESRGGVVMDDSATQKKSSGQANVERECKRAPIR